MQKWIFSCFLLLSFGCNSNLEGIDKEQAKNILRIGHGGLGFASFLPWNPYPINSMTSLRLALEKHSADGLEVDVRMTKDKKFVLYHDMDLSSSTLLDSCVEIYNYEHLVQVKYALGFPFDLFQEEFILGLEDLIDYLKTFEDFPHLHIDLRVHSPCFNAESNYKWEMEIFQSLASFLKQKNVPKEKVIINTFARDMLSKAIKADDGFPLSLEVYEKPDEALDFAMKHRMSYLTIKPELLSKQFSQKARNEGVKIITFGGNSAKGNLHMIKVEADIIQSNNLEALNDYLMPLK